MARASVAWSSAVAASVSFVTRQRARLGYAQGRRKVPRLHVFRGECDWVAAYDKQDAWAVFAGSYGCSVEDANRDYEQDWIRIADDTVMYIWLDNPSGVCLCDERRAEQLAAAERYRLKLDSFVEQMTMDDKPPDVGSHMWCFYHRLAKRMVAERKVTSGTNGHYKGCHVGWPRRTCRQWCDQMGRGLLASTEF